MRFSLLKPLTKLFAKKPPSTRRIRPRLEALEERWCPASLLPDGYDKAGLGNSPATAVPLGTAAPGFGLHFSQSNLTIDSAGDVDYFQFDLTGEGAVVDKVKASFVSAAGDLDIRLFRLGNNGVLTLVGTSDSVNNTETIFLHSDLPGTYILKVEGFAGDTNKYSLVVDSDPIVPVPTLPDYPVPLPTGVNGVIANVRPQLQWQPVNATGASYQIWMDDLTTGATNIFPASFTASNATPWTPPADLVSGHSYRWWARRFAFLQTYPWGPSQDFTVAAVQIAPPKGPIYDLYPNIAWTGVQNAASYQVWIDNVTTGQTNIFPL